MSTYSDDDVRRLVSAAKSIADDRYISLGTPVMRGDLNRALEPFCTTPEDLRMERGRIAYVTFHQLAEAQARWESISFGLREHWCRVADAVLLIHERQQAHGE